MGERSCTQVLNGPVPDYAGEANNAWFQADVLRRQHPATPEARAARDAQVDRYDRQRVTAEANASKYVADLRRCGFRTPEEKKARFFGLWLPSPPSVK
jgi:hypothetical protein